MANLEALLNDLANLDAQHDLDGMRKVREQILAEHPNSDEAVEAQYKIGLDFLFRQRDIMAATEAFATAAKRKHPYWSPAARISLGLCYYHQKRTQKAVFELRRIAFPDKPNIHSVTALTFLENIFQEEGNKDEVARTRKERVNQLEKLVRQLEEDGAEPSERGYAMLQLGVSYRDQGDDAKGKEILEKAKALGEAALGADLHRSVMEALG